MARFPESPGRRLAHHRLLPPRQQLQALRITAHDQHGRWNYSIAPAVGDTTAPTPQSADERAAARTLTLQMLADPRLTGMTDTELNALRTRLAPDQEAQREQRRYVLRGGRRVATTGRNRSLLSNADEVLVTVVYLRQVCPQKVLCDLLGVNPVTIEQAIKAKPGSSWTNTRSASRRPWSATSPVPRVCAPSSPRPTRTSRRWSRAAIR